MLSRSWQNPPGKLVLLLVLASNAILAFMALVHMPAIESHAGGLAAPEVSQSGYDANYVTAFMTAAGEEGRNLYLTRQLPVDMVYPVVFLIASLLLWRWLWLRQKGKKTVPVMGAVAACAGAGFDWAENTTTLLMLTRWPIVDTDMIAAASLFTQLKFAFVNVGLLSMIAYGGFVFYQYMRQRQTG